MSVSLVRDLRQCLNERVRFGMAITVARKRGASVLERNGTSARERGGVDGTALVGWMVWFSFVWTSMDYLHQVKFKYSFTFRLRPSSGGRKISSIENNNAVYRPNKALLNEIKFIKFGQAKLE